jgi:hypothetical protein
MSKYYVNDHAQASGDHEVHKDGCTWLGLTISKTYLGEYSNCFGAVAKAKEIYSQSDGCAFCSPLCNHG